MTDYFMAICESGHLIDSKAVDEVISVNIDIDENLRPKQIATAKYSIDKNFCQDCGSQILTNCPVCNRNIEIEYNGPPFPEEEQIPDFCHYCGAAYPWTSTVEAEKQRDSDFLKIDDENIDGPFYPGLVHEINLCYRVKADHAVLVLNRKLMESLTVDILRTVFSMDQIELFYDTEEGQTHSLSILLDNMKDNKDELDKYTSINEGFFRSLEEMKQGGDASAHAIEENPSQEDLSTKSQQATTLAKILFRMREEAKTAHRNR